MTDFSVEEKVDNFFADSNVQRLVVSTATWNPLAICYLREVNASRFLAWLLDSTQGHGLGDLAAQSLLTRAGLSCSETKLSIPTRRFLAASNIQTESFSSFVITTEVDLDGRFLDVLAIDTSRRRYIAIENKFGSRQSEAQLKDYRKQLEKLFPDFLGIHILLDSNEAEPGDEGWIAIGYDWLTEFLREAEHRSSTAQHVRDLLAQFREAVEEVSEDAMGKSPLGRLITEVAADHAEVLGIMSEWFGQSSKSARAKTLAKLTASANTLEGKAILRLFQIYWRRSAIWDKCSKQSQFAPFVNALRQRFDDVDINPKRVLTIFSREQWDSLVDTERLNQWFYPARVDVRQTGETFRVTSVIQLNDVRQEKRDSLRNAAEELRQKNGVSRQLADGQTSIVVKRAKDLDLFKAVQETVSQCEALQAVVEKTR